MVKVTKVSFLQGQDGVLARDWRGNSIRRQYLNETQHDVRVRD